MRPNPYGPGQESVWSYPRPPRLERANAHLSVVLGGVTIAETNDASACSRRVTRRTTTSRPSDVLAGAVDPTKGASFCEFKGRASYWTVAGGDRVETEAAWSYESPSPSFAPIRDHYAFYAEPHGRVLRRRRAGGAAAGGFYGGWITSRVAGPFKGSPGSRGW